MNTVDPIQALVSFQKAFEDKSIILEAGVLDPKIFVTVDYPNDKLRYTYVRLDGDIVTALVMFVAITPLEGKARLQIGYAVHPEYRGNGLAKNTVKAAIEELKHGLQRAGYIPFYVEAMIETRNIASQHVAASCLTTTPTKEIDKYNGEASLYYLRLLN